MNATMFRQIFFTQWLWTRVVVLLLCVASLATPSVILRLAQFQRATDAPYAYMAAFDGVGLVLSILALLGAFVLAVLPWTVDAETRHVYPLALPTPWSQYVGMRFLAGVMMLMAPAVALYLGSWMVLLRLTIPDVLRVYAADLAVRYFLALVLAYAASFALQYVFGRRATLAVLLALLGFGALSALASAFGWHDFVAQAVTFLFRWPGPFAIYTEPWRLLDV